MPNKAINARGIRPVRLHGENVETAPLDQRTGNGSACPIEFAGAMRGLAEQHHFRIPEALENTAEFIAIPAGQWLTMVSEEIQNFSVVRADFFQEGHAEGTLARKGQFRLRDPAQRESVISALPATPRQRWRACHRAHP